MSIPFSDSEILIGAIFSFLFALSVLAWHHDKEASAKTKKILDEKRHHDLISLQSNIYYKPRFHYQITHGKNKGAFTCSSAPPVSDTAAALIQDERSKLINAGFKVV